MTNHIHLAMQVGEISISRIVHNLCSRYSKRYNRRHGRTGHLFEGRFRSFRVDTDEGAMRLVRYIHLNPFRAGLTEPLGAYPWSSQGPYLHGGGPNWLTTDWIANLFGRDSNSARRNLEEFVLAGLMDTEDEPNGPHPAPSTLEADSDFPAPNSVSPVWKLATLDQVLGMVLEEFGCEESWLASRSLAHPLRETREFLACLVRECRDPTFAELAIQFGRDSSTLSHAASRLDSRLQNDDNLKKRWLDLTVKLAGKVLEDRRKVARSDCQGNQ